MKKEWLWGPGRIAPEHKGLTKRGYLERLATVRDDYLGKLLENLQPEDIPFVRRLERARFSFPAELDRRSEEEFHRPRKDAADCRECPNREACEAKKICDGWSLADFAAHMLTHEQKNVDPGIHETIRHMAEHEETHLHQVRKIVGEMCKAKPLKKSP